MIMSSPISSSSLPSEWRPTHDRFICRLSAHPDLFSFEDIIALTKDTFPELRCSRLTEAAIDLRLQIMEYRGAGLFAEVTVATPIVSTPIYETYEYEYYCNDEDEDEEDCLSSAKSEITSIDLEVAPELLLPPEPFYNNEQNRSEPLLKAVSGGNAEQRAQPKRGMTYGFYPLMGKHESGEFFYLVPDIEGQEQQEGEGGFAWNGSNLRFVASDHF